MFQFDPRRLTTDNYRNRIKSNEISKWILFQIQLQLCECEGFQNIKDRSRSWDRVILKLFLIQNFNREIFINIHKKKLSWEYFI